MEKKRISRRDFIKAAGLTAGVGILAACAAPATPVTVIQTQIVNQTQLVPATTIVNQTQVVQEVVTATPAPSAVPAPAVMDIWAITTVADLNAKWAPDPANDEFKKEWWTGGLLRLQVLPFLAKHPGVTAKVTGHSWDWDLRQNEYLALAAGITPDTSYGEAYVTEFVTLGLYAAVGADAQAKFPASIYRAVAKDGKAYGLPETTGANILMINLNLVEKAGLDPAKLPTTWDELTAQATAISKVNKGDAFFTYAPEQESIGSILRISAFFEQNNAPIASDSGVPTINTPGAADTWVAFNTWMYTSKIDTILKIEAGGEGLAGSSIADGTIGYEIGWTNNASSVGNDPTARVAGVELPIPTGGKQVTNLVGTQNNSPFLHGPNPALAIDYIETSTTNEDAQNLKPNGCGIWIPALKSMLEGYATYDKLGGFKSDAAKALVRVTMKAALSGAPIPGWPKNGGRIWNAWNDSYAKIWKGNLGKADIQTELDALQKTVEGLVTKSG